MQGEFSHQTTYFNPATRQYCMLDCSILEWNRAEGTNRKSEKEKKTKHKHLHTPTHVYFALSLVVINTNHMMTDTFWRPFSLMTTRLVNRFSKTSFDSDTVNEYFHSRILSLCYSPDIGNWYSCHEFQCNCVFVLIT